MTEEELLDQLDKLNTELDSKLDKNMEELYEILRKFTSTDWANWLEDILVHGVAYPVSRFSSDGDVLLDMVDYLQKNDIPTIYYEEAISDIIGTIAFSYSNLNFLESLLNSLIALGCKKSIPQLLRILQSGANTHQKGKYDYIKSLALLALARSPKLGKEEKHEIRNYVIMAGLFKMKHDPIFYSSALAFCYSHFSVADFFNMLTNILKVLTSQKTENEQSNDLNLRYVSSIIEKIKELYLRRIASFYSSITNWLLVSFSNNDSKKSLIGNELFTEILVKIGGLFQSQFFKNDAYENDLLECNETNYGSSFQFLIYLIREMDLKRFPDQEILRINAFLLKYNGAAAERFLLFNLREHVDYVCKNYGKIIPDAQNELKNDYTVLIIQQLLDIYDESLYQPGSVTNNVLHSSLINSRATVKNIIDGISTKEDLTIYKGPMIIKTYDAAKDEVKGALTPQKQLIVKRLPYEEIPGIEKAKVEYSTLN